MKWSGSEDPVSQYREETDRILRVINALFLIIFVLLLLLIVSLFRIAQADASPLVVTGIAGWYGPGFYGRPMRNGEVFDSKALTFAMNGGFPDGRPYLLVWAGRVMTPQGWLDVGKVGIARARWTDTGAFTELYGRVADLSPATMEALTDRLGFYYGLIEVRIYPLCADLHMRRLRRKY